VIDTFEESSEPLNLVGCPQQRHEEFLIDAA
jgi:hypothetical protein